MTNQPPPAVQEFAAILREGFLEVAVKGWQAHEIGVTQDQMLIAMAPAIEPLVQSIVRKVANR